MTTPIETSTNISRRRFLQVMGATALGTSLAGVGGFAYVLEWEPSNLELVDLPLTLPRLPSVFSGYRIAQISDIHIGSFMTQERLQHVVDIVNAQQVDVVVITGDFVTEEPRHYAQQLILPLAQLDAPDGVYAVLGNHDHWTNVIEVRSILARADIQELSNAVVPLQRDNESIYLAGLDDYWERYANLNVVLPQIPADACAILLVHEPDFADISAATGRFDLQLSGHSHGGQVVLPGGMIPLLPQYGRQYPSGLYQVEDMLQYTNRGIGMVSPEVRFNCRPEITVITLLATSE